MVKTNKTKVGAKAQGSDGKDYEYIIKSYQKLINFLTHNNTSINQIIAENVKDKREISKVIGNFYALRKLRNSICHPETLENIDNSKEFVQILKDIDSII